MNKLIRLAMTALMAPAAASATELSQLLHSDLDPHQKGMAVAVEQEQRDTGFGDISAELQMILIDEHGREASRLMRNKVLEGPAGEGDKNLIVFDQPRDIKGTALLTYSMLESTDQQWLFLPAVKRVKRIASNNRSGPFLGSEFSYEDMSTPVLEKYEYRFVEQTELDGVACYVIESTPKDENSGYSRIVTWVDTQELRMLKSHYYDRENTELKTLTAHEYRQFKDQYWRPSELRMHNHQTGKSTRLVFSEYLFGNGFSERHFSKAALASSR